MRKRCRCRAISTCCDGASATTLPLLEIVEDFGVDDGGEGEGGDDEDDGITNSTALARNLVFFIITCPPDHLLCVHCQAP
jgi:hypothetical protein